MDKASITKLVMTFGALAVFVIGAKYLPTMQLEVGLLAGGLAGWANGKRPGDVQP